MANDELIKGRRYRVVYKLDGQRKERVLEGVYLGWSRFYSQHDFDLRPEHGTTSLPPGSIIGCTQIGGGRCT